MKILIAGQFKSWALENHYARHLGQHAEVFTYPAEDVFDDFYHASMLNKVKYRLGATGIYDKIGSELLAKAEACRPDLVWVFKGMRILPKTLQKLRGMGIKTANYNPDHPFLFSSRGSGNRNVSQSIGLFDLHLCYSRELQQRIEREYGIPTAFLPFGHALEEQQFEQVKDGPETLTACFVGNPDKIRTEHIQALSDSGLYVDVYGHGWDRMLPKTPNVRIFDAVYGVEYWQKLRAYRLQVNIFRPHNEGSHNMRTFEVPAVGGIMLAPDSPEHREFFKTGKEVFLYRTKAEMAEVAKHILALPAAEAARIRASARARSVNAGFSYQDRAAQAYRAFQNLLEGRPQTENPIPSRKNKSLPKW